MRYFDGETIRILYRAKRNMTELTDVKIDIWDDTPTKLVSQGTLTELSDGLYYYDYSIPSTGNFMFNITCATQPHDVEGSFTTVGRQSPYWNKRGGGSMIVREGIAPAEFEKISKQFETLGRLTKESIEALKGVKQDLESLTEVKKVINALNLSLQNLISDSEVLQSFMIKQLPLELLLGEKYDSTGSRIKRTTA